MLSAYNTTQPRLGPHVLPPFASAENQELNRKLREKAKRIQDLEQVIEENLGRRNAMLEYSKKIDESIKGTQTLVSLRTKELEETHQRCRLIDRETSKTRAETAKLEEELTLLRQRTNTFQAQVLNAETLLSGLQGAIKEAERGIGDAELAEAEATKDALLVEEYLSTDDSQAKTVQLELENLQQSLARLEAQVSEESAQSTLSYGELESANREYGKAVTERQERLKNLELTVRRLRNRDKDINDSEEALRELEKKLRQTVVVARTSRDEVEQQESRVAIKEKETEREERKVIATKEKVRNLQQELKYVLQEVAVLEVQTRNTKGSIYQEKAQSRRLAEKLRGKEEELEKVLTEIPGIQRDIQDVVSGSKSRDKQIFELETIARDRQAQERAFGREARKLSEDCVNAKNLLDQEMARESECKHEISATQGSIRHLESQIAQAEQESVKQQSLLYRVEYQIQALSRKLARLQGERTLEESERVKAKICELNKRLAEEQQSFQVLKTQLARSEDELRGERRKLQNLQEERAKIEAAIDEYDIQSQNTNSLLVQKTKEHQNMLLEESLVKVKLMKLRQCLMQRENEYRLAETQMVEENEKHMITLKELESFRDIIKKELRLVQEEQGDLGGMLKSAQSQLESLETRLELTMKTIPGIRDVVSEGVPIIEENGKVSMSVKEIEEKCKTMVVLKHAQEKERLETLEQGLEGTIGRGECELQALEASLWVVNQGNSAYSQTKMYDIDVSPDLLEYRDEVFKKASKAKDTLEEQKAKVESLKSEVLRIENEITELDARERALQNTQCALERAYDLVMNEVDADKRRFSRIRKLKSAKDSKLYDAAEWLDAAVSHVSRVKPVESRDLVDEIHKMGVLLRERKQVKTQLNKRTVEYVDSLGIDTLPCRMSEH